MKPFLEKRRCQLIYNSELDRYGYSGKVVAWLNWLRSLIWKYSQTPRIPGQCPP